jgi:hypothetical protein
MAMSRRVLSHGPRSPACCWCCSSSPHPVPDGIAAGRIRHHERNNLMTAVQSTSDDRTANNTMRHQYRVLNDAEKANMQTIKDMGLAFHDFVAGLGGSRELSLAKTKIEEAVMWGVKHITA